MSLNVLCSVLSYHIVQHLYISCGLMEVLQSVVFRT